MQYFLTILLLSTVIFRATPVLADSAQDQQQRHEKGRDIYNYRCYFCHGYSGDAKTLTTTYLNPPPRDFTRTRAVDLPRQYMIDVVRSGKQNTAMHGFSRVLNDEQISLVVDFVRDEFIEHRRQNTKYHTLENGWPNHDRYRIAFPFATGTIALDSPQQLSDEQKDGRQMFMSSCISCHDRAIVEDEGEIWSKQSISYPRNNYSHSIIDAVSSASIYALHDTPPQVDNLSAKAVEGRQLWQQNCAFCHAADGSGENWIGSFLDPKPRNLNNPAFMLGMTRELLAQRIKYGLSNTSMPAWKDVLNDQQIDKIISYIDEVFHHLATE